MPRSVRGQTVLLTVLASAVAMVMVVAVVAAGTYSALRSAMLDTLEDRLDIAEAHVGMGDFEGATDDAGSVHIAVLDETGALVATNSEVVGHIDLASLLDGKGKGSFDIDDEELGRYERDDRDDLDDDDGDDIPSTGLTSRPETSVESGSTPTNDNDNGDWDDDDGDDRHDGSDDDDWDDGEDEDGDDDDDWDDLADFIRFPFLKVVGPLPHARSLSGALPEPELTELMGEEGPYLFAQRQATHAGKGYTIVAMSSIAGAVAAAKRAVAMLAATFALLLVGIAWFAWTMTGKSLALVEQMRASAEEIIGGRQSTRIPVPVDDPDLAPLAVTFNGVIDRLERELEAQQRFISDASHELKSPVAAISVILDAIAANPESLRSEKVLADLTRENSRMRDIVADLLALARHDEGTSRVELAPTDLIDVVLEQVAAVSSRSKKRFDTSAVEPVIARTDTQLVSHALRNLLENAERFAEGEVTVSCSEEGGRVRMVVSDDGPGIAPEDRERVFGRFVRLDRAEGSSTSTGLGLAVVRSVAESLGGTAYFAEPECGGATAVLEFPA